MSSLKKHVVGGVFWTTLESVVNRGFGLIIELILARLLFPEDYGLVGMAAVFISFLEVFTDLGMNAALIQKKEELLTPKHYDTAFWTGVVWAFFLFLIMVFAGTPLISKFYGETKLLEILPIMSLTILFSPINLVHRAQLIKKMDFKRLAFVNNASNIIAGLIAVTMAFAGFGVWALVLYAVAKVVVAIPFFFKATKWVPKLQWQRRAFNDIFGFGIYTTGTSFTNMLTGNIDYLLVGKLVGSVALGFYTFAFIITNTVRNQIVAIVNKVIYPVYASMQDSKTEMVNLFLKVVSLNNLLVYPVILAAFLFAEDLLPLFFGDKWNNSVPLIKILSFAVFIQMLINSHTTLFRAAGKVRLEFILQIIKSVGFFVPLVSLGVYYYGLEGAAYGFTIATLLGVMVSFYYLHKIFNLHVKQVFKAVKASIYMLVFCLITTLFVKEILNWQFALLYYAFAVLGIYYIFAKNQIISLWNMVKSKGTTN